MFTKLSSDATVIGTAPKTHAVVPATLLETANPLVPPGDQASAIAKTGVAVAAGWLSRGYRDTKSFSF